LQRVHHQNQVPNFPPQISSIGHERGEPNFTIKRTKANENQPKKKIIQPLVLYNVQPLLAPHTLARVINVFELASIVIGNTSQC